MSRRVFYVEVPGFYACVERAADPALARRPVVVGGDPRKGGLVQAATSDAAAAGVTAGMPMLEALERCPGARALRTDMRRYREASAQLFACLRRACERLEEAGLGGAYFEGAMREAPEELAAALRERVADLETLEGPGVPGERYAEYLELFGAYNDSVQVWESLSEGLRAREARCRRLVQEHNALVDALSARLEARE